MSSKHHIQESNNGYVSIKSVAKSSKYSTSYVARLCKSGKVKCIQTNSIWSVNEKSFTEFVNGRDKRSLNRSVTLSRKRGNEYYKAQNETEVFVSADTYSKAGIHYTKPIRKQSFFKKILLGTVSLLFVFIFSSASLVGFVQNTAVSVNGVVQNSSIGLNVLLSNVSSSFTKKVVKASGILADTKYKNTNKKYKHILPTSISLKNDNVLAKKIALLPFKKVSMLPNFYTTNRVSDFITPSIRQKVVGIVSIKNVSNNSNVYKKVFGNLFIFKQSKSIIAKPIGLYLSNKLTASPLAVGEYIQHATGYIINKYTKIIYLFVNLVL